jgi:hypothetical protein
VREKINQHNQLVKSLHLKFQQERQEQKALYEQAQQALNSKILQLEQQVLLLQMG